MDQTYPPTMYVEALAGPYHRLLNAIEDKTS